MGKLNGVCEFELAGDRNARSTKKRNYKLSIFFD
jgi:hypothetical protein